MKYAGRLIIAAGIFLLGFMTVLPTIAYCANFSADMSMSEGGSEQKGRIIVKDNLLRMEMTQGSNKIINITRPDKGVNWTLMPSQKMYMERPFTNDSRLPDIKEWESKAKMKVLGVETVNGYKCEKRHYESVDKSQGPAIVWFSAKLNFWVKIHVLAFDGEDESIIQFTNIKQGDASDDDFEVDSTYQKFTMPAGMPSGMPGGMPGGGMPGMGR